MLLSNEVLIVMINLSWRNVLMSEKDYLKNMTYQRKIGNKIIKPKPIKKYTFIL